ncbi:carbohydrate binding family 9 domain-containing protein [Thalassotalea sp. G2M2-11]|uniref:carbohydrate binding family 9 domain-containing protein n=1 Tax=Thalassotalea sp. G2M2-11 TaxID=2787627 RepID=UPI0019D25F90|nr:carbohydrate binding family 9 domain-containing protein [Thalassotalea sp. G2M2-11]
MFAVKTRFLFTHSIFFIIAFLASSLSFAQQAAEQTNIMIPRMSGDITIDAKLDEPQWQNAQKVLVNNVTRPHDNIPSPVNTEALLMEDGETFYLAFIAHDPNPEQIRAFLRDRDKSWGDDVVGIKIDTYNDQRTAYRFLVNPLGSQIDGIESEITKKESDSWDGIWDSAGEINDEGYVVELALPLRMLNFTEKKGLQDWGIELLRLYPRDERLRLSNVYLDRANNCELCQLHTAEGFSGAKQGDNLTITPSVVTGKNEEKDSDNSDWHSSNNTEASLDLRWGITPDLLLNATINPDFSTVETDNAQLNINNNFALYFQEKRPFFLDNADYFDSNYNLVYTRNINAPNYGAKLTGRQNNHSFGLFVTDDSSTSVLIPGNRASAIAEIDGESKATAFRYRYNYNDDITLGWISTLRSADGYHNGVHGIDARFRLNQYDVFKFQSLYSNTQYPDDMFQQFCGADDIENCQNPSEIECQYADCQYNEPLLRTIGSDSFSGNAFKVGYYHNDSKWFYRATYDRQNAGFRGDLGFISRVDQNKFSIGGDRKWYAKPGQWWSQFKIYSDWDIFHNDNNELIEKEFDINAQLNALYGTYLRLGYSHRNKVGSRHDKSSLAIDGNTTLFTEKQWHLSLNSKPLLGVNLNARINTGDAIDYSSNRLGESNSLRLGANWNINKHLEFRVKQIFRQLNADGANVFNARLSDIRATYQFNINSFLRLTMVYNNTNRNPYNYLYTAPEDITVHSKNLSSELLYAYKINPQTVFYLGYSDNQDAERNFSDLERNQRSVFMKFSYAWIK